MSDNKKDDYGYFGTGIDGYVHYKQTFDQSFHDNNGAADEPIEQNIPNSTKSQEPQDKKLQVSKFEGNDLATKYMNFVDRTIKPFLGKGGMNDLIAMMLIMLLFIGPILFIGGLVIMLPLMLITGSYESAGGLLVLVLIGYTIYWKLKH